MGAQAKRSTGCQDPCPGQCPSFVPTRELMRPGSRPARAEETPRNQAFPFLLPFSFPGSASQAGVPHKQRAGTQETGTSSPSSPIQELPYNNPCAHSEQDPGPHAGGSQEKLRRILSAFPTQRMHFSTQQQQPYTSTNEL